MHTSQRPGVACFQTREISDVKGHLETIMCVFRNGLPTHSLLKRSRSHTALSDPPFTPPCNNTSNSVCPLHRLSPHPPPVPQLPLSFIFCRPFQYRRSSSSLSETMSAPRSSNSSALLLDHCLDPELVKKNRNITENTRTHIHTHVSAKMWVCLIIPC